ncbi:D-alanyl-D-alanine carboxypeptidase/D-alanyl-D-alanine endopeptidase [Pontibacter russatus]|uniref:D-alanyl-D-alanine carboxypeptidase/D-alanyl-D-alanine endopeptidase n=1 Tax=Pontibacter russatus TaxID=2694929 RepID=UPI001379DDC5|nr:D-alanyl-D-alanine carboxypeptidase/D-alanyl-D-alanine-endopeptidase [Pontibacter russatus]
MRQVTLRLWLFFCCVPGLSPVYAQSVSGKLAAAFKTFRADPQLRNGMAALYVVDARSGEVVFGENETTGLAPASTLKVITSASAYELLGKDFRYKTGFAYHKSATGASLLILPGGDPTLGSWRWSDTKEDAVLARITQAVKNTGIKSFDTVVVDGSCWEAGTIPDGWLWQDIGNYYGAGPAKLNWRENQFDVILKSGKRIGDPVTIVDTQPAVSGYTLRSELASAAAGTGDQAYIYFPLNGATGTIRGTIPVNQSRFSISGAMPDAPGQFVSTLQDALAKAGIKSPATATAAPRIPLSSYTTFHTVTSPPLDSIIYWFNRKSINLYGEALLKTIAYKGERTGATEAGVELIKLYWKQQGIPETELNIVDGSGLSPLNRVTAQAQVSVLQHARKQPWFGGFYASLPVLNGMKMKSGTMHGVKGYSGYHRAKDGKEYIFSFVVNNYNGPAPSLVKKMYKVLDALK